MTYEEVIIAMEEGKQLQIDVVAMTDGTAVNEPMRDCSYDEAQRVAPCYLRIKPEEPKERGQIWINEYGSASSPLFIVHLAREKAIAMATDNCIRVAVPYREVRPGDLTREEVLEKIENAWASGATYHPISKNELRYIFGVEECQ